MTIRQYHQHHSLRDEEDLFHSALSSEFDDNPNNHAAAANNSRPWASRTRRDREPYELLDDVPPANLKNGDQLFPDLLEEEPMKMRRASTERVDNRSEIRKFESEFNLFPDALLDEMDGAPAESLERRPEPAGVQPPRQSRYPVEELYPTDNNDVMMNDCEDNNEVEYDLGNDDDYYSHMQYSEPVAINPRVQSRYPIDDSYEAKSVRFKKVAWNDERSKEEPMVISPTESHDEIDSYQPMHVHNSNKGRYFDDNDTQVSSHYSDDNKSTGTFDRLYDEEYSGIYNTPVDKSERSDDNQPSKSPSKREDSLMQSGHEHSPDSVMGYTQQYCE
jgi:hypothetical protein